MGAVQTSRDVYKEIQHTLGRRQLEVLDVIERHSQGITNNEIARERHWPINCVTPRVFELRSAGLVALVGKRQDKWTGKMSCLWGRVKGVQLEFDAFKTAQPARPKKREEANASDRGAGIQTESPGGNGGTA